MSFQDKLVNAITRFTNFKFVKCMQQGIVGAMNARNPYAKINAEMANT